MVDEPVLVRRADVVVVGGGPVGLVLGRALASAGLAVVICESRSARSEREAARAGRPIALAHGSRRILEQLNAWASLEASVYPIRSIDVSEQGSFGVTRLIAAKLRVPALGYVVDGKRLESCLSDGLAGHALQPAVLHATKVNALSQDTGRIKVHATATGDTDTVYELDAQLVVLAHGVNDELSAALGLSRRRVHFDQSALIAEVEAERAHGDVAFERFTPAGPLALLPLAPRRFGLVWTGPKAQCEARVNCAPAAMLGELMRLGGGRFGNLCAVQRRHSVDLAAVRAEPPSTGRVALVGNAAQSLHPVAGQGLNLGLRDAATLAEVCVAAHRRGEDIGAGEALTRFRECRHWDRQITTTFTDMLAVGFSNDVAPLKIARGVGLAFFDLAGPLKRAFARRAMGLGRPLPRLMRGLPL